MIMFDVSSAIEVEDILSLVDTVESKTLLIDVVASV